MIKPLIHLSGILALCAGSAAAQATQTAVLGPSDNPVYSERIQASDGVIYICKPDLKTVDGKPTRECLRESEDAGTVFSAGTGAGLGLAPAIGGGLLVLVAIASDSDGGVSTTTTTTAASR